MAVNYSSCTMPAAAAEDGFGFGARRGGVDWRYEEAEADDVLSRLPSDPFGMEELSSTFSAALAGWISDLSMPGRSVDDCDAEMDYYWSQALASEPAWVEAAIPGLSFPCLDEIPGWYSYSWVERDFLGLSSSRVSDNTECSTSGGGGGPPPEGLVYALAYLDLRDLLSVERVCRTLRAAVHDDTLLWRCVHVDAPLNQRITDVELLGLTRRAQGSLECLSLSGCTRITDQGLMSVLQGNPKVKKLGLEGCLKITVEGLISNLKMFNSSGVSKINHLKLGRLFSVSPEQFEELKSLVDAEELCRPHKPWFYHEKFTSVRRCDDGRWMDIELCPICQKFKVVFDCPLERCRAKELGQCRGCEICIARCVQCGRCIEDCRYVETFCLQYLCGDCWKNSPLTPERREE